MVIIKRRLLGLNWAKRRKGKLSEGVLRRSDELAVNLFKEPMELFDVNRE